MKLHQRKRQLLLLMILLLFVSQACTDIFVPGLPIMTKEFAVPLSQMNLSISVFTYSQAFFFLIIGVFSDLFGRRKIFLLCIPAQIIASFGIAATDSLALLVFLRIVQALGSAAIYIVLRLVIKDVMDKHEQIHANGVLLTGLVLSPALAPMIGAWLINLWGWRSCFIAIAVSLSLLFIWLVILIHETNSDAAKFRAEFSLSTLLNNYSRVLSDRMFFTLIILIGGTFASYFGFIAISSYMYIDEYHISNTNYSYTFIAVAMAYLAGNRIMLWLNKEQTKPWRIVQYGLALSLLGLGLMIISLLVNKSNILLILAMVTVGILLIRMATAFINPPLQVLVMNYFGSAGAHALGMLSCVQYIFAGLGTAMVSGLPFLPSVSLVVSSIFFTFISLLGYWFCPHERIRH